MVFNREKLEEVISSIVSDLPYFGEYEEYRTFASNYIMYLITKDPFYYGHAYKSYLKLLDYYESIPDNEVDHKRYVKGILNAMLKYLDELSNL